MNCIIFLQHEVQPPSRCVVTGERARYLKEWHSLKDGIETRAGMWGGNLGRAKAIDVQEDSVEFEVRFDEPPFAKKDAALIVAAPRPQTVKKVIQSALSFGVAELHFIRSEEVVPSYLDSKTLQQEGIYEEMLKAMEQTCDTIPLQVSVHPRWYQFCRETLPGLVSRYENRFVAHTRSTGSMQGIRKSLLVAVGPESGWTEAEVETFERSGFNSVTLGERMLRVEHAVAKAVSGL